MSPIPLGILAASGSGGAKAFDLLNTTILSSTATSVTFDLSSFTDYEYFQFRIVAKANTGTGEFVAPYDMNVYSGPSSGTYRQRHYNAASTPADVSLGDGYGYGQSISPSGTYSVVSAFWSRIIFDWHPGSASIYPSAEGMVGPSSSGSINQTRTYRQASVKEALGRETEITFNLSQVFRIGCRFSVYGWKAA